MYVHNSSPLDSGQCAVIADAVASWALDAGTLATLGTDFQFTAIKVTALDTDESPTAEVPVAGAFGTHSGALLPNNVSLAIHKTSAIGGASAKGRVYHPSLTAAQLEDANTVSDTSATEICEVWRNLRDVVAAIDGLSAVLAYVSYVHAGVPRVAGLVIPILDFICKDRTVDSQRRRLPGRGL